MTGNPPTGEQNRWVHLVLGIDPAGVDPGSIDPGGVGAAQDGQARTPSGRAVRAAAPGQSSPVLARAAADPQAWTRGVGPALLREGTGRPGARIQAAAAPGPMVPYAGPDGRTVGVATGRDGSVALSRPPAPIREITFSGGGGKGAALPGAVKALAGSGVLKGVTEVHGASVGSMSAAMLAAGMTPEMFQKISDDTKFAPLIKGGDLLMLNVDGNGLEGLVRDGMISSLNGQIAGFASDALARGVPVDPAAAETLRTLSAKFAKGGGPTFGDLRTLSKIIPDVKEAVISGTMLGKVGPGGFAKGKPELMAFSADTQPDMEVARAVHASAALPPVFKPVELRLADGTVGRFEDGGVLNNAPSSDTLGTDRAVDPVPPSGKMTFVFEGEAARGVLSGNPAPKRSRLEDVVSGADLSAAEFGVNRAMADRAEDVVMVPLTFAGADGKTEDFTGLRKGLMNFDMARDDRLKLQGLTQAATLAHLEKRQQTETRAFASAGEMLMCAGPEDVRALAAGGYPGAAEAARFRDEACGRVRKLEALAKGGPKGGAGLRGPEAQALLAEVEALAGGDQDRVAFVGRELNRTGALDPLLAGAASGGTGGAGGPQCLAAGAAVHGVLDAKALARGILRDVIYPKMVREDAKGIGGNLLRQMDQQLRDARSAADIRAALRPVIEHYGKPRLLGGFARDADFAAALARRLPPPA